MACEAHVWLKRLPSQIADEVGYKTQPAIPALAGDGVSKQRISNLENHFYPRIKKLVEDCDEVREFLRVPENMETEFDDMVLGCSKVGPLIQELEKISGLILATVPNERDYSVWKVAKEMGRSKRNVLEELEGELPRHLILKDADCDQQDLKKYGAIKI